MNNRYLAGIAFAVVITTAGLTSCGIKNPYKAPEIPENIYRADESTDTTTIATIPWRTYFSDPYLQALIDEGLENSFDLQIAVTRIRQSEANLKQARGAFFPSLTLGGKANQDRFGNDGKRLAGHNETYTLGATASWEFDAYGKLFNMKRGAVAQYLQSQEYRNVVQTSLIANIANTYYALLALDEKLDVTKESIALLQESVNTMEVLKDAAILNGAAVEQSKSLLYGTAVTVPDLEIQIRKLENSLCLILGREPSSITRSSMDKQTVPTNVSHGIPVQMLARRPDVKQAEYALRIAFEYTGIAKGNMYPSINIAGTVGYMTQNGVQNFFRPENIIANLLGGITQPLFARNQLTAGLKIARAQQEEALLNFQKTILNAGNEVSDVLFTYEYAMKKNAIRDKQILALETSVDFTKDLLNSGDANYVEVLTAQQNLIQAQLGQVSDKLQQLQATVDLYRSLGGGLE